MRVTSTLLLLAISLAVNAAPAGDVTNTQAKPDNPKPDIDTVLAADKRGASRSSCGQYKFDDGTVQEFYGQVWAGIPADRMVCHHFKYGFRSKKGQEGTMVAAKVDFGCTCFFYE